MTLVILRYPFFEAEETGTASHVRKATSQRRFLRCVSPKPGTTRKISGGGGDSVRFKVVETSLAEP